MAKIFYARPASDENPMPVTPIEDIRAKLTAFWGTSERLFPIPYWKFDKMFKDYNKVAIYVTGDDKDDLDIELRPFISANIHEYESSDVRGVFFVISESIYNFIFLPADKPRALCFPRVAKTEEGELSVFLHKSLPISFSSGNAGPDGAGGGMDIP